MSTDAKTELRRQPVARLTADGKLIPPTPEEMAERVRMMDEAIARINAEPGLPGEYKADLAILREIDDDRAARGLRRFWKGIY